MDKLLERLVAAESISGFEENIREVLKKELKPYVDSMKVDKIGNLIAKKGSGKPVIMLAAHMDIIGLVVKYIDDKGFIYFDTLGSWDLRILPGLKLKIMSKKGPVTGVIGMKPVHLLEKEEEEKPLKEKDFFIDIGAKSKKDVEKIGVQIGDFITEYDNRVDKLIGDRITGRGLDNRVGCYLLIEIMKRLKGFKGTVYAVGTIGEEISLIGVRGSAFSINPDVVLALDTGLAGDFPMIKFEDAPVKLGEGPILTIKDAVSVIHPNIKNWIVDTAKKEKIKLQYEIMKKGATDASVVPMIREGIPSASITIPARYIHTPIGIVDMKDVEASVKLVVSAVKLAPKYLK